MGIKQANGEFLTFIDADDGIEAQAYLDALNRISLSRHDIDIVFLKHNAVHNFSSINSSCGDESCTVVELKPISTIEISNYAIKYIHSPRAHNPLTHCWGSLLRRCIITEMKLEFYSKYNQLEDISFMCKMLAASKHVFSFDALAYHHNLYRPNRLSRQAFFPVDIYDFVSEQTSSVISLLTNPGERDIEYLSETMVANHILMFYVRALSGSSVFDSQVTRYLYHQNVPINQICHRYTPNIGETRMLPRLLSRKVPHLFVRIAWWLRSNLLQ